MRLILVRHGDAHAGFHGVIGGQTGCAGLTPLGRAQAEALRDHLADSGRVRADVLLASVLPRAIETAEIIAPGLGLEIAGHECDLCEVHTGEADGLDWDGVHRPLRLLRHGGRARPGVRARGRELEQLPRAGAAACSSAWPPTTPTRRWWPCATPG